MPVIYNKKVEYAYTDPGVKAHTLSWAEYQALSEDDKMNGDLYFIPDKQPEGNPSRIWTKLGTDPLTTQADDVSGAVNELNSSLSKFINGGDKTCTVNSSGLLNLSVAFNIPPNAYDVNVEVINDIVAPSGVVRWTNGSWYVFILAAGTGNTIERRPNTDTTVRCSWRIP